MDRHREGAMRVLAIAATLIALVVFANANGGSVSDPASGVKTDKPSYGLAKPVKINFVVENRTNESIVLRFPSGQHYDIWVQKDDKEIWRWSRRRAFVQVLTSITLAPGQKKVYTETWNQVTNDRKQVPPGAYSIFAQLTTVEPRPTPVKTRITIGTGQAVVQQTTVSGIVENINAALGKLVQLSGTYRGWRPDPNSPACRPGPPVTRSDWAISDNTGCIFVTGRSGLDPVDDIGKSITVSGIVRKTSRGQPYIEVRTVMLGK